MNCLGEHQEKTRDLRTWDFCQEGGSAQDRSDFRVGGHSTKALLCKESSGRRCKDKMNVQPGLG